jgi:AcrR family transcriptional regulator
VRRRYTLGRRQQSVDATRERIVSAARELLASPQGAREMTIEAVARAAAVTRATVYGQFDSKQRLLAAVLDALALEGGLDRIPAVLQRDDPVAALDEFIALLVRFYAMDRAVHRQLTAMADIDPALHEIVSQRQGRRRGVLTALVKRIDPSLARAPRRLADAVDALFALTSPTILDHLGDGRSAAEIAAIVQRLARSAIPPAAMSKESER